MSKKLKKLTPAPYIVYIATATGGSYLSWSSLGLSIIPQLQMTKLIDDFTAWQDLLVLDAVIEDLVSNLAERHSL